MKPMIDVQQLSKMFGTKKAVDSINLQVEKGELFCFLGPNGSGKTTTMKMMTGLLQPSSGKVQLSSIDVWANPVEAKKRIAYVPDQPNMYDKLTGNEYLRFIASVFSVKEADFQARKEKYITLFELEEALNDRIESYSHGMKQKLNLSAALLHQPDVLFLDEPTVGLDPKGAKTLRLLLRELCDEEKMTVFMTTHLLEVAAQMCDRVGIVFKGELIAVGSITELQERSGQADASLEDLFLAITADDERARTLIASLRGDSYAQKTD
ncbi:ABC-2 type transport system ATP-binding protein [Alkalihalobacillus xiaoxiensis]|uniref:ABC-2 type transport system ATP-binding protein n=1 Tax=Shouchella xiaoxiensis TaxID=766895 RepID=A0ABS2SQD5_9BACI|nr:ABC transporter ATP-binding protein [Shouchella xiaoxiensis]MBM7837734.1 ABC-2 type transport system ATP-binding protein [Shouchella xiaoxiensis]